MLGPSIFSVLFQWSNLINFIENNIQNGESKNGVFDKTMWEVKALNRKNTGYMHCF